MGQPDFPVQEKVWRLSVETTVLLTCPVCDYPRCQRWRTLEDRFFQVTSEFFVLYYCSSCGLRFQKESSIVDRIADFYPSNYWWNPESDPWGLEKRYREWVIRQDQLRFLLSVVPNETGCRLLDIGCGGGTFLKLAEEAGFQVQGLESSRQAGRVANGIIPGRVFVGNEQDLIKSGAKFQVLTLFHVLEHLPQPFRYLKQISKLLTNGGGLVVQVPNCNSLQARILGHRWYGFDCPRHINNFTSYGLMHLLGRCGYRIRRVRHFSLRDNGAALVSSLVPGLDPMSQRVRLFRHFRKVRTLGLLVRELAYLGLLILSQPFALLEAALGRGGTVTIYATRD